MKVKLTNNAADDLEEFSNISKATNKTAKNYIVSMLNYTKQLGDFPEMGKYKFDIKTEKNIYSVRQLVFRQHKILYYYDEAIHILGFLHSKLNEQQYFEKLKNIIDF